MKKGEKATLWTVGAVLAGIILFTVYMEIQMRHGFKNSHALLSGSGALSAQSGEDADDATVVLSGSVDPAALPDPESKGATLWAIYCMQCHALPSPSTHTSAEWPAVLARMIRHIQARRGMMARVAMPSARDWDHIQAYASRYAPKPLNAAALSDLSTPEGRTFQTVCSQCHAAPDPAQHTAREWPAVVVRMKYHMRDNGKAVPSDQDIAYIVAFLKRHAA